jgi:hypothetical protein
MVNATVVKNRKIQFLRDNSSLLSPIDTKHGVWIAFIMIQLWILLRCLYSVVENLVFVALWHFLALSCNSEVKCTVTIILAFLTMTIESGCIILCPMDISLVYILLKPSR